MLPESLANLGKSSVKYGSEPLMPGPACAPKMSNATEQHDEAGASFDHEHGTHLDASCAKTPCDVCRDTAQYAAADFEREAARRHGHGVRIGFVFPEVR